LGRTESIFVTLRKPPSADDVARWIGEAKALLRAAGKLPSKRRKTGAALEKLLGLSKPIIATRVGRWMADPANEIPDKLINLVRWIVADLVTAPDKNADGKEASN